MTASAADARDAAGIAGVTTIGESLGKVQAAPRIPIALTPTRKAINASLALDYRDLGKEIHETSQKLRGLIAAKNDIELLAATAGVTLEIPQ